MAKNFVEISALHLVLSHRKYLAVFLVVGVLLFFGYGYLLSSSSMNLAEPKVAMGLNIYSLIATALISILLSLSIVMSAFSFSRRGTPTGKLSIGAAIAAIIPSSLCCTALIPSVLAVLGVSTSTILSTTGALQGPFATYETPLIVASIALLSFSVVMASRSIVKCCAVKK